MGPIDDVETYCENGVWKTRWRNSAKPFAAGGGKQRLVSQGATVAQWYGVDHIITNPTAPSPNTTPTATAEHTVPAPADLAQWAQSENRHT